MLDNISLVRLIKSYQRAYYVCADVLKNRKEVYDKLIDDKINGLIKRMTIGFLDVNFKLKDVVNIPVISNKYKIDKDKHQYFMLRHNDKNWVLIYHEWISHGFNDRFITEEISEQHVKALLKKLIINKVMLLDDFYRPLKY